MLTKTPDSQAAEYANGVLNAINQTLSRAQALLANGAVANPQIGAPATTAASVATAFGPANFAFIQLMVAASAVPDPAKLQAAAAAAGGALRKSTGLLKTQFLSDGKNNEFTLLHSK